MLDKAAIIKASACKESGMVKCPRCFHWSFSMNLDSLCNKCVEMILDQFPEHESVAGIIENLKMRGMSREDNPEFGWIKQL